jgi:tetratricopeptide (TPR) repeat protein
MRPRANAVVFPAVLCGVLALPSAGADDAPPVDAGRSTSPPGAATVDAATGSPPASAAGTAASVPAAPAAATAAAVAKSHPELYSALRQALDAKDYAAAIGHGRSLVAAVRADPASTPEDLQTALMTLGAAQSLGDDASGAEQTYQEVIGMLEAEGQMTSPRMTRATAGLANAYYEGRRYDLAAQAYDRAILLNRRNEGLFNEEQLLLLDRQADSLTALGRYQDALQALAYGMRIADRRFGQQDPRTLARLEQLGRWYTRVGAYDAGRQALRSAVRIIEKKDGPNSADLVGPLTGIAESYRRQLLDPTAMRESAESDRNSVFNDSSSPSGMPGRTPGLLATEGERALERAVEIVDRQPKPPPLQVADVRTQMGDWYQTRLQPDRALPHYKLAWSAAELAAPVDGKPVRELLFGKPVLLHYLRPTDWDRYAKKPAGEVVARTVEIDLTVSADGRVRARKLVSNEGDEHMAEEALEAADSARYRPRFVDGDPVETTDVRMTQTYFEPLETEDAGETSVDPAQNATTTPGDASTPPAPAGQPQGAPQPAPSTDPAPPPTGPAPQPAPLAPPAIPGPSHAS